MVPAAKPYSFIFHYRTAALTNFASGCKFPVRYANMPGETIKESLLFVETCRQFHFALCMEFPLNEFEHEQSDPKLL